MPQHQSSRNELSNNAPRFATNENVARLCADLDRLSKSGHKAAAMQAAETVPFQFTRQAKVATKERCLGHLILSLLPCAMGGEA